MLEFKDITIDNLNKIETYLKNSENYSCEFSKGNIFMWNIENDIKYALIENMVVFRNIEKNTIVYSIPYYDENSNLIEILIDDATANNKTFVLHLVSKFIKEKLEAKYGNRFRYTPNRNHSDYIYNVEDLVNLRGKKYQAKKNHINFFLKNYSYSYEKLTQDNLDECRELKNIWLATSERSNSVEKESIAIDRAFEHFQELGFSGALIRVDGMVKAFTFGEELNRDVFVTHVEKADVSIRGTYPMINREFAANSLTSYKYVNREEDLGIEGLRRAKESYVPALMWEKYEVRLNG